jgi:ABC-type amino acid transport system permease subunit
VGVKLDVFVAGALSLVLFYAAYLSEIFRAAIAGVHPGQNEAAHALGLGRGTTFGHVVLPQALRLALPGTNTMFVDLIKSTSLLVTISAAELMTQAQLIASETFRALEVYLVIAAIYFAICYPVSQHSSRSAAVDRAPPETRAGKSPSREWSLGHGDSDTRLGF